MSKPDDGYLEITGDPALVLALICGLIVGIAIGVTLYASFGKDIPRTPAQAKATYERLLEEENARHQEALRGETK